MFGPFRKKSHENDITETNEKLCGKCNTTVKMATEFERAGELEQSSPDQAMELLSSIGRY